MAIRCPMFGSVKGPKRAAAAVESLKFTSILARDNSVLGCGVLAAQVLSGHDRRAIQNVITRLRRLTGLSCSDLPGTISVPGGRTPPCAASAAASDGYVCSSATRFNSELPAGLNHGLSRASDRLRREAAPEFRCRRGR